MALNRYDDWMNTKAGPRLDAVLRDASARVESGDAAIMLAHVLSRPRAWLYAHGDDAVDARTLARFDALLARRALGEPVAYLTGLRGFWTFELEVSPATLIPRAETERLIELALARMPVEATVRVADLGTGSGAIALALARERPRVQVVATDISVDALAVAQGNAERLEIGNVTFRHGSWCEPLRDESFALIASNPPYIGDGDTHLSTGDLRFEPAIALASGGDGLDAIRAIVRDASSHLLDGGWLLLEHGWEQGAAVRALLASRGFVDVATERDLEDRDRVTLGCRPG